MVHDDQADKVNEQQYLQSVFSEYKEILTTSLEKLKNSKAFGAHFDVENDVIDIINLTNAFFTKYENLFVGYV